jgi:NAD(P)H-nitrite reductase large subunit
MLDRQAAEIVESWLKGRGIDVHTGASAQSIREADDGSKIVELTDGTEIATDVVIVATGIRPNVDLLDGSGVTVNEGILVNDRMQTNVPHIYAGGDVAKGPSLYGGVPEIHAIQPTAVDHGRVAGANMAGEEIHYPGSLLMNILDVCGLQNVSYGNWSDPNAEATTICNTAGSVYRKLLWTDDEITGAVFAGRANDLGMLTDVGMVKGLMQTRTRLGTWKSYLQENPFDIRRPFVASNVAKKLADTTLLGRPSAARKFQADGSPHRHQASAAHGLFHSTKSS